MTIEQATDLIRDLRRDEAYVRHAYQDSEGYLTIGIGRLIDERKGGGITEAEAEYLLANDIAGAEADLDRNVPWWREMSPERQRALLNMCFNMGWPTLARFRKTLAALESGDYEAAAEEAMDSKWARQVGARAGRIKLLIWDPDAEG